MRARDGTWWLTWKFNGNVTGQPTALLSMQLGSDGEPVGPVHTLLTSDQPWEAGMLEAPSFVEDQVTGTWWLTFSAGDFGTPDTYQIAAVPCASLAGPCDDAYRSTSSRPTPRAPVRGSRARSPTSTEPCGWCTTRTAPSWIRATVPWPSCGWVSTMRGCPTSVIPLRTTPRPFPSRWCRSTAMTGGTGYWLADAQGFVTSHGTAINYGDMAFGALNAPIVKIVPTPDGKGYWLVGADGGIFTFGDAGYFGSTGNGSSPPRSWGWRHGRRQRLLAGRCRRRRLRLR